MPTEMILPSYDNGSTRQEDRAQWARWRLHVADTQWQKVVEMIRAGENLRGFVRFG